MATDGDYQDVSLRVGPRVTDLLSAPSRLILGGRDEPDIESPELRLRIGRRPIARNLRKLYTCGGRSTPEEYEIFWSHEIWLLNHSVGLIREIDIPEVLSLGYELRLLDDSAAIVELLPQHWFVNRESDSYKCEADIRLNGRAYRPTIDAGARFEDLHFGGRLESAEDEGVVGRVSFLVMTPRIQAIGAGDAASTWLFQKHEQPLAGYQSLLEVVVVDKHCSSLACEARARAAVSGVNGVPVQLESKWVPLNVKLE